MDLIVDMRYCLHIKQLKIDTVTAKHVIQSLLEELNLDSLKKIVVTGDETKEYREAITKYAYHLRKFTSVTDDSSGQGYAVVIHALNSQNELEQLIFIRESLFCALLISLSNISDPYFRQIYNTSIGIFMHEIGHALEYQKTYTYYGYLSPDKQFDLSLEYKEYIYHEGLSIWSEYYAERIANLFVSNAGSPKALADYIHSSAYPQKLNEQIAHSYRVAYFFAHYVAQCDEKEIERKDLENQLNDAGLSIYSPILLPLHDVLSDVMARFDCLDFYNDSKRIAITLDALIRFEHQINLFRYL